ncbi:MAG: CvpA family protein [Planctomycetia bacterium]|nr:CvpA family protein [Planctomycetia bacterium]
MVLNVIFIVIVLFIVGGLARDGLWSNTITLFNTILSAIIATCYFEPLAQFLTSLLTSAVHVWDIISLGLLFAGTFLLLRTLTGKLSRFRVRFHPLMENFGGVIVAFWIGWTAVCFVCFTLHTAPLTRNFFDGGFDAEQKLFFGLQPDRLWLGFMQKQSDNGGLGRNAVDAQGNVTSMFDPKSEFMLKYASRRAWLDTQESLLVN